jgi:hypothetical protein
VPLVEIVYCSMVADTPLWLHIAAKEVMHPSVFDVTERPVRPPCPSRELFCCHSPHVHAAGYSSDFDLEPRDIAAASPGARFIIVRADLLLLANCPRPAAVSLSRCLERI